MPSQYGELRHTNGCNRFGSLGHPSKFQRVSRLGFVTAATSLNGGQPNFAPFLAVSWTATLYIHFRGLLSTNGISSCKIHFASKSCVLLYWQRYCTALQQRTSAKRCGIVQLRNGITELSQRAPRVFGWAAITLASAHILVSFFSRKNNLSLHVSDAVSNKILIDKTHGHFKVAKT